LDALFFCRHFALRVGVIVINKGDKLHGCATPSSGSSNEALPQTVERVVSRSQKHSLRQGLVRKKRSPREQGRDCTLRLGDRPYRVGGHMGRALRELRDHDTQKRCGNTPRPRDVRVGSDRPDVSQCLRPVAADGRRLRVLREDPARGPGTVDDDGRP
jgi:hypothetical protein